MNGARREAADGERRCAATRVALPAEDLLRFVADPQGVLVPDVRRKLPGRGVWTALSREAVEKARATGAFARSLKRQVSVPADLAETVDALLARDALQAFAMANKAGLVVSGFDKVEALAGSGAALALVEAADGAPDGRRKLMQALRRAGRPDTPVIDSFASGDLALALGRDLVIHAALRTGAASEAFLGRSRRLAHFRTRPLPSNDPPAGAGQPLISTAGPTAE